MEVSKFAHYAAADAKLTNLGVTDLEQLDVMKANSDAIVSNNIDISKLAGYVATDAKLTDLGITDPEQLDVMKVNSDAIVSNNIDISKLAGYVVTDAKLTDLGVTDLEQLDVAFANSNALIESGADLAMLPVYVQDHEFIVANNLNDQNFQNAVQMMTGFCRDELEPSSACPDWMSELISLSRSTPATSEGEAA